MKKWTKEQKATLAKSWDAVQESVSIYWSEINVVEAVLRENMGIDVEVFHVDGCPVGFGDYGRKYELFDISMEE